MIIKQIITVECYCDNCGEGMLQPLLTTGFMYKMGAADFIDSKIKCDKCKKESIVEDAIVMLPEVYNIWSIKSQDNFKKNDGIQKYLKE